MPRSLCAPQSQCRLGEEDLVKILCGEARPSRSAACTANQKLSAKAKMCSPEKRKRKIRSTRGTDGLNTIAVQLGCEEAQDAIRESISLAGRSQHLSGAVMSLRDSNKLNPSKMSLVASWVQRETQHSSPEWINAVTRRFDVVFLARFYAAACQEVSEAMAEGRLSMFLKESTDLLRLHNRQPTERRSVGYGGVSRVRDRLIDFTFLDGRPESDDARRSMRTRLENMQRSGKRWRYLIDHVHQDVLILLPHSVTDNR